jgi:hypothetical protein
MADRSLDLALTAVDEELTAGDVSALVGSEECVCVGDLIRGSAHLPDARSIVQLGIGITGSSHRAAYRPPNWTCDAGRRARFSELPMMLINISACGESQYWFSRREP